MTVSPSWKCLVSASLCRRMLSHPTMAFSGVRISWLRVARNTSLARLPASASRLDACSLASRQWWINDRQADLPGGSSADAPPSQTTPFAETHVRAIADDDVVEEFYAGQLARSDESTRERDVVGAWRRVAARVIVRHDDRGGVRQTSSRSRAPREQQLGKVNCRGDIDDDKSA